MKKILKKEKGFSAIEVIVVATTLAIIIVIGTAISSKIFLRRSVDNITNTITSQLTLVKLQSSRNGVEFRAILNFDNDDNILRIISLRGDSNNNSIFPDPDTEPDSVNILSTFDYKLLADYQIIPSVSNITFSPDNLLAGQNTITIRPSVSEENAKIRKCGVVNVSNIGRISATIGKWNFSDGICEGIAAN